ncbi:uncharacterized protein BDR25DRAFT_352304 [Lindgomyces ingoldianus]|uniref:Uncharacterized protein n=1 Tax=Lindgomyces ingoldianus TaxID=673940 RepID=A0ACB6R3J6_9PLEO|nr:uncharacterized protein BDR25DRAFT_352304 [Lindgomyces ingoldianus]KAF2473829.1 hypothetical protein BDR25DRAFT_352304 [Lindgomyces ingoldianus]
MLGSYVTGQKSLAITLALDSFFQQTIKYRPQSVATEDRAAGSTTYNYNGWISDVATARTRRTAVGGCHHVIGEANFYILQHNKEYLQTLLNSARASSLDPNGPATGAIGALSHKIDQFTPPRPVYSRDQRLALMRRYRYSPQRYPVRVDSIARCPAHLVINSLLLQTLWLPRESKLTLLTDTSGNRRYHRPSEAPRDNENYSTQGNSSTPLGRIVRPIRPSVMSLQAYLILTFDLGVMHVHMLGRSALVIVKSLITHGQDETLLPCASHFNLIRIYGCEYKQQWTSILTERVPICHPNSLIASLGYIRCSKSFLKAKIDSNYEREMPVDYLGLNSKQNKGCEMMQYLIE